jgi:adenylate cyclase
MSAHTEQRKLAAIMFTDMVGYSALAQRDESLALELLEEHRRLLRALFPRFNGTEIKTIGDGFLVEFGSALQAAQCAIEIQRAVAKRNTDAAAGRRIEVRIGIHLGDVIHREGDVLGDGVNIASRLEPLAGPGGICISMDVERQVRHALDATLVKLPTAALKNIAVTMEIYRIVLPWQKAEEAERRGAEPARKQAAATAQRVPSRWTTSGLVLAVVVVLGGAWWWLRPKTLKPAGAPITSLAVKPLDDFSGDTSQAYLSDGMTEALCAALGNISALRVPGRSSVMRYKGGNKSIGEIARELDVDAIVEGSVQRTTTNMLVTVQLIEAATDRHLWATNYRRDLSDFFVVQSEVARAIASEIQVRLTPADLNRLAHARPAKGEAVEACLLGMHEWWEWSDAGFTNALRFFERAREMDSRHAPAYAGEALTWAIGASWVWRPTAAMPKAKVAAEQAIALDPQFADGYIALGCYRVLYEWDWPGAEKAFKQGLELTPNSSLGLDLYQNLLLMKGRFSEALPMLEHAVEHERNSAALSSDLGISYYYAGQFDQAIPRLAKALELSPKFLQAQIFLGWCYQFTGKPEAALAQFEAGAKMAPDSAWVKAALGYAFGRAGRRADALKLLAELEEMAQRRYVPCIWQAFVHVGLGENDRALDWLEKSYAAHDTQLISLKLSPVLAPLRNEPRYQALLKKMRLDQ